MDNLIKTILFLFFLGFFLTLLSALKPWWNETTGQAAIDEQLKADVEACAPYKPHRMPVTKVLMCEKATLVKPGK